MPVTMCLDRKRTSIIDPLQDITLRLDKDTEKPESASEQVQQAAK